MSNQKRKFQATEEFISLNFSDSELELDDNEKYDTRLGLENSDDSSDSSPEAISFKVEEQKSIQYRRHKSDLIKMKKTSIKDKQKEIQLRNLEQKEEKLKKLQSKRLPDEILEVLDHASNEAANETIRDCLQINTSIIKSMNNSDYIKLEAEQAEIIETHGPTVFKLKVLPKDLKKRKYVSSECADFQSLFFSNRIRREPNNQAMLSKREKQLAREKPK